MQDVLDTLYRAIGLAIALSVHELAEAYTALRLGDASAKRAGWLRLDRKAMVDPFGTLLLPGILLLPALFGNPQFLPFAYAKPMPLNRWSFKKPDRDEMLVAIAGPVSNIAIAFVFGLVVRVAAGTSQVGQFYRLAVFCLLTTIVIGVLNLVPIPPLDGSRIIARFLPPRAREVFTGLQQYGALFMLLIFFILPGPIEGFVGAVGNGICRIVTGGSCPLG
jgi:Zn-dependent protease